MGATGRPFRGTDRKGNVRGFADMHLHITANQRAGGAVIYGEPFDPYGISEALGHDADVHGADGSADVTGNLLRTGLPFGTHDTHGWPTFSGWPVNDTVTHQQTYYVWLQRAWMAGERLVVAQTVEDQPICEIEPVKVPFLRRDGGRAAADPDPPRASGVRRRPGGRQGQGLVPARLQPSPGTRRDREGPARGADRDRVLQPLRLQRAGGSARMQPAGRRSGDSPSPSPRRAQRLPDALDRQRLRRLRSRGRRQGALHQRAGGVPDRPLLPHRRRARSPGRARNSALSARASWVCSRASSRRRRRWRRLGCRPIRPGPSATRTA